MLVVLRLFAAEAQPPAPGHVERGGEERRTVSIGWLRCGLGELRVVARNKHFLLANCLGGEVRDLRAEPAAHCDILFPRLL